jgi:hypothetical protein
MDNFGESNGRHLNLRFREFVTCASKPGIMSAAQALFLRKMKIKKIGRNC